jgi:hypothetical protein
MVTLQMILRKKDALDYHQLGRHGLEFAAKEHIEEQGLQDVVAVVAERDLGRPQFTCHAV